MRAPKAPLLRQPCSSHHITSSNASYHTTPHHIESHTYLTHHTAPHQITSHHSTSSNTSYHTTSHHFASHHFASHHTTPHCITSHPITPHHITSHHIPSHPIPSHPIPSHPIPSNPITPHHNTSHHIPSRTLIPLQLDVLFTRARYYDKVSTPLKKKKSNRRGSSINSQLTYSQPRNSSMSHKHHWFECSHQRGCTFFGLYTGKVFLSFLIG